MYNYKVPNIPCILFLSVAMLQYIYQLIVIIPPQVRSRIYLCTQPTQSKNIFITTQMTQSIS